ncbi:MAG TPA: hypothetical protein VJ941_07570, partial [Gracilimonas sp.]|nr:hypothetical protein [Gracilimonas sp.]
METDQDHTITDTEERQSRFALRTLLETSKMLVESQDPDFVLNNLLLITMGKLLVTKGIILIQNGGENSYRVSKIKGQNNLKEEDLIHHPITEEILKKSVITGGEHPKLVEQLGLSEEAILFNLRTTNHHLGFLCLGAKGNKQPLAHSELEFIESLAIISSVAIANSRMFQELRLINRKLDRKVHDLHTLLELG